MDYLLELNNCPYTYLADRRFAAEADVTGFACFAE